MKICDSCGTVGGGHTPFCRYKNSDPTMLDVHTSHRVMPKGKECVNCKRSDVVGLTLECKVAQPVESFVIHPSHRLSPKAGQPVKCELCDASSRSELEKFCSVMPSPVETPNEMRDRLMAAQNVDASPGTFIKDDILWMIYNWDHGPYVVSVHASPEEAIAANSDANHIGQWKIGVEFREAVKLWESRNQ